MEAEFVAGNADPPTRVAAYHPMLPINALRTVWRFIRGWHHRYRVELGFALRVTVAATVSLAIAQYLELRLPLWTVLTAVIVTEMSAGESLKATFDYLVGTIGGAVYGGAVAVLIPHSSEWALLTVLAIAVAPLAFASTINPRLRAAPVTAIIVLLIPMIIHATPLSSAIDRVLEVTVGAVTGCAVSLVVLPSRAHAQAFELAAGTLDQLARALPAVLAGQFAQGLDTAAVPRIRDAIGRSLERLNTICAEAEHEHAPRRAAAPALGPLTRTLLRLHHDLVMLGRAAQVPLPTTLRARLQTALDPIQSAAAGYLSECADALRGRHPPPSLEAVDAAFDSYLAEVTAARSHGLTRELTTDTAERVFAVAFALDQIHLNLKDLHRCVSDCVREA